MPAPPRRARTRPRRGGAFVHGGAGVAGDNAASRPSHTWRPTAGLDPARLAVGRCGRGRLCVSHHAQSFAPKTASRATLMVLCGSRGRTPIRHPHGSSETSDPRTVRLPVALLRRRLGRRELSRPTSCRMKKRRRRDRSSSCHIKLSSTLISLIFTAYLSTSQRPSTMLSP